jgi:hypothetical protein
LLDVLDVYSSMIDWALRKTCVVCSVSAFHEGIAHFGLDPFFAFLRAASGFLADFFFARADSPLALPNPGGSTHPLRRSRIA